MSVYDDIIGGLGYDIIGQQSSFNGQFNQPNFPQPNWGPVPGAGANIGPMALAIGQEDGAAAPQASAAVVMTPGGPMPMGYPGFAPGFPGFGPWGGWDPALAAVVPNGNAVASLIAARDSALVAPRVGTRTRKEILGFGRTCVAPCGTVTVEASPQVLFKPKRLLIPSSIAFNFVILDIKFGKWNLFANGGAVPAAAFIETAEDTDFNGDTVQWNGKISITVQNISNAESEFTAAMWGLAIE